MEVTDDRATTPAPAESRPIRLPVTVREHAPYVPTAILGADGRDAIPTPGIPWDKAAAQIGAALNATASHDKLVQALDDIGHGRMPPDKLASFEMTPATFAREMLEWSQELARTVLATEEDG